MAFDGVTIACVISELKKELIGGTIASDFAGEVIGSYAFG